MPLTISRATHSVYTSQKSSSYTALYTLSSNRMLWVAWVYTATLLLAKTVPPEWGAFGADGAPRANVWTGTFPPENNVAERYVGAAPVGSFPADELGAFDLLAPAQAQFRVAFAPAALVTEVVRQRLASAVHRPGLAGRLLTDGSASRCRRSRLPGTPYTSCLVSTLTTTLTGSD